LYLATNALRRSHTRKQARCTGASAKRQSGSVSSARKSGVRNASSSGRIVSPQIAQCARPDEIRSDVVGYRRDACLASTVGTAEERTLRLNAVPQDLTSAMIADWRQLLDRALETVKRM
jgi:hypothetical protein